MKREWYFAPKGLGISGTGTKNSPIYGLNDLSMVSSGDTIILKGTTFSEQFIVPVNGIRIISEDAVFDFSISLNADNSIDTSYTSGKFSSWQLVDAGLNIWKKGCGKVWQLYIDEVWAEPMPLSLAANSEATILAAINKNEWTITSAVTTDSIASTIYLRLDTGITPNSLNLRASHTRAVNTSGSTSIMAGAIEAVAKEDLIFDGQFNVIGLNNSAGTRVCGFYFERCVGINNSEGQFYSKYCYLPLRVAGGDDVRFRFKAEYCNNSIAIQNSNEATAEVFAKAGTIEVYDWEANYCGWMPRYDGTQVNGSNDQDGGVGIGYKGGSIATVIVRDGVSRNGGPSNQVLKTGWAGTVAKGSAVVCGTADTMSIDRLLITGNRVDSVARVAFSVGGAGLTVFDSQVSDNFIKNTRGCPIATNNQASIISCKESVLPSAKCKFTIANNTIINSKYSAAGIFNSRLHADSEVIVDNNILQNVTLETGYAGNYGGIQLAQITNASVNANIFDGSGSGVFGRIVSTSHTTLAAFNTAVSGTNIEGTVTIDPETSEAIAGTANPIWTGVKYWANGPRPNDINGEPRPDTYLDIGAWQSKNSPFHPSNLKRI